MASIKDIAKSNICEIRDGIAWIAVWKRGRSWKAETFFPDMMEEGKPEFSTEDSERIREIIKEDENAVILNSYYHNLGGTEDATITSAAAALAWQYDMQAYRAADYMSADGISSAAAEEAKNTVWTKIYNELCEIARTGNFYELRYGRLFERIRESGLFFAEDEISFCLEDDMIYFSFDEAPEQQEAQREAQPAAIPYDYIATLAAAAEAITEKQDLIKRAAAAHKTASPAERITIAEYIDKVGAELESWQARAEKTAAAINAAAANATALIVWHDNGTPGQSGYSEEPLNGRTAADIISDYQEHGIRIESIDPIREERAR